MSELQMKKAYTSVENEPAYFAINSPLDKQPFFNANAFFWAIIITSVIVGLTQLINERTTTNRTRSNSSK